jgi:hypothetical protein
MATGAGGTRVIGVARGTGTGGAYLLFSWTARKPGELIFDSEAAWERWFSTNGN